MISREDLLKIKYFRSLIQELTSGLESQVDVGGTDDELCDEEMKFK